MDDNIIKHGYSSAEMLTDFVLQFLSVDRDYNSGE